MNIGMVCYASVGGSGVVATELAHALALRGHTVHLISSEPPFRWRRGVPNMSFVPVEVPPYPLFREPQYLLALATTVARVAEERRLDIVHAHYAVPHATAAYLAYQMLDASCGRRPAVPVPRTVTTLHGTDITLVGSDPSYARAVAFSIEQSHGVTTVSESLKADTIKSLGVLHEIRVIPNFLDCTEYRRRVDPELRARLCPAGECDALVVHVSNFRPVKRVLDVVRIFERVAREVDSVLLMVGEGPERSSAQALARRLGRLDRVRFLGQHQAIEEIVGLADVFLLPSELESFGLAALEAMARGVPVVGSDAGGLPEVVRHAESGYLLPVGDVEGMATRAIEILKDDERRREMGQAARQRVESLFGAERVVGQYEAVYNRVLGR